MRIWDAVKINTAIKYFLQTEDLVDPIEWLSNPLNIVLENDKGDLALFEYGVPIPKNYSGHYFFQSRGREAITAATDFLDELFNTCYNIHVLIGLVPKDKPAAKWLSRRVGFTPNGTETIGDKEYELFILTRKEFNNE